MATPDAVWDGVGGPAVHVWTDGVGWRVATAFGGDAFAVCGSRFFAEMQADRLAALLGLTLVVVHPD
ncbi:MAG: hypothetical protein MUE51_14645 [Thermoleophilia bacterium]|nr:hypothetical protein [Thermoleophilia bacterium]